MDVDELRGRCQGGDYVPLRLPPPNVQCGSARRLAGRRGPRGEALAGNADGQTVRFLSSSVLRFLDQLNREAKNAK